MINLPTFATREDVAYTIIVVLIAISILGPPLLGMAEIRYAVYVIPYLVFLVWLAKGQVSFCLNRQVAPFLFLLFLMCLTAYDADYNWLKKAYFVIVYSIIFFLFDMTRATINIRAFNLLFIAAFGISELLAESGQSGDVFFESSFSFSESRLESTYAFPLGLFAIFFLVQKQYIWFLLNVLLAIFAFKRIVIGAIVMVLVASLIPGRSKKFIVNPYVITSVAVLIITVLIDLASGKYDALVSNHFGVSANQLLMGRQVIWAEALDAANYSFETFVIYGFGHGEVTSILQTLHSGRDILLHSDLLLVLLEHGFISFAVFVFLLNNQKRLANDI